MKLIDVDSKATLEDFLRKCNEKISGNKNELVLRASNANQVIYAYGANSSVDERNISTMKIKTIISL
jgi:hypothetical protein